jgi:hypothetical protein
LSQWCVLRKTCVESSTKYIVLLILVIALVPIGGVGRSGSKVGWRRRGAYQCAGMKCAFVKQTGPLTIMAIFYMIPMTIYFIGDCLVTESKAIHLWRNNVGKGLW